MSMNCFLMKSISAMAVSPGKSAQAGRGQIIGWNVPALPPTHAPYCLEHRDHRRQARITLFDARAQDANLAADPRTLALSLGSVQMLQRLAAWPAEQAEAILQVHVSQAPPSLSTPWGPPEVLLTHSALRVPQLGAVLSYGALLSALQTAWLREEQAQPQRLRSRFGTPVAALKDLPSGVEVDAGVAETFDLVVVAEGGVFGEQARKAITHDYGQTAWVGTAQLQGAQRGRAYERFTRQGPAALLPLPPAADGMLRAALVWCVNAAEDPVRNLSETQRLAVLNTMFPPCAGRITALSPLKGLPLGLNAERTLAQHRTVRIGNAAQTLHPVAGQGLNLGLRDAHTLVTTLLDASDIEQALQRIDWQRAPDRWATIATTDFLARSFTWQLPGAASLRGLGLAALQAAPPLQRWLARRMMFGMR
jgi:2-octaprenyl-6-methoxyphenol hydroxylase